MSLAHAMAFAAWTRYCGREPQECREEAEAVITYATELRGCDGPRPCGLLRESATPSTAQA